MEGQRAGMCGFCYSNSHVGTLRVVQAPQFSFTRLHGADPTLGVEMASTGEVCGG